MQRLTASELAEIEAHALTIEHSEFWMCSQPGCAEEHSRVVDPEKKRLSENLSRLVAHYIHLLTSNTRGEAT